MISSSHFQQQCRRVHNTLTCDVYFNTNTYVTSVEEHYSRRFLLKRCRSMFRHVSFAAAHSYTVPIRTQFHFSFSPSLCRRRPVLKFLTNANSLYKQQSRKHGEKHLSRKSANSDAVIESGFSIQAQAEAPLQPSDWLTPDRQYLLRLACSFLGPHFGQTSLSALPYFLCRASHSQSSINRVNLESIEIKYSMQGMSTITPSWQLHVLLVILTAISPQNNHVP